MPVRSPVVERVDRRPARDGWDEVTQRDNADAFRKLKVHYRVLVDVSQRDVSTCLLGHRLAMPILIAPTGSPIRRENSPRCAPPAAPARR